MLTSGVLGAAGRHARFRRCRAGSCALGLGGIGGAHGGQLVAALGSERTVLVLDNCEHVVAGCRPLLAQLVADCVDLWVIPTSCLDSLARYRACGDDEGATWCLETIGGAAMLAGDLLEATARLAKAAAEFAHLDALRLVAAGFTDLEIARQLVLSPRTIHAHLRSIYRKMGVGSRTAAVVAAADLVMPPASR
jgi:DNA-binding CsgD family transcriptional regulator